MAVKRIDSALYAWYVHQVTYYAKRSDTAHLTISSKRQITLPAAMVRELGLEPGDKLTARLEGDAITLTPRPRSWVEYISGSLKGTYGSTKEEVDQYVREVREGWDERAQQAEGGLPAEE
jgi:AbrB family looped-hinge helix DNA binding protein